ncbi:MAG: methyltransferase [Candidatus Pacearchaeota archaeon]|nr:methyltransferase [Candidatus Pacearchaeota archaeon]
MNKIYEPAEDSHLMTNSLKRNIPKLIEKNPHLKILEIGSGSGIQLKTLLELGIKKNNITCCDLNNKAIEHCKELGFNCIKSNLFENIKEKYNIIIFNPPYLPEDKNEPEDSRLATTGGKKGSEIINKFLKDAKKYLSQDGIIFLLTSSLSKDIDFLDYYIELVAKKKIFFEELFIWELKI